MKTRNKLVKRKSFNWTDFLLSSEDQDLILEYWRFRSAHLTMSSNRCAWNVLKSYYSTTTLAFVRKFGYLPEGTL